MVTQAVAAIALGLLGLAGVTKVVSPEPTHRALQAARLPSSRGVTRSLGVAEITAAVAGLAVGGAAAFPALALYAGFTLFSLRAVRSQIPMQSCGCFGRADTPPSRIHVVYNAAATVSLIWLAVSGGSPVPWTSPPLKIVLYSGVGAIGVYVSYLLLTRLPQTLQVSRNA